MFGKYLSVLNRSFGDVVTITHFRPNISLSKPMMRAPIDRKRRVRVMDKVIALRDLSNR